METSSGTAADARTASAPGVAVTFRVTVTRWVEVSTVWTFASSVAGTSARAVLLGAAVKTDAAWDVVEAGVESTLDAEDVAILESERELTIGAELGIIDEATELDDSTLDKTLEDEMIEDGVVLAVDTSTLEDGRMEDTALGEDALLFNAYCRFKLAVVLPLDCIQRRSQESAFIEDGALSHMCRAPLV